jgi:hypothetical protein
MPCLEPETRLLSTLRRGKGCLEAAYTHGKLSKKGKATDERLLAGSASE